MIFLWVIVGYLAVLLSVPIWKSFMANSQEGFMVAGRKVFTARLAGALLRTWRGSGSFAAGTWLLLLSCKLLIGIFVLLYCTTYKYECIPIKAGYISRR